MQTLKINKFLLIIVNPGLLLSGILAFFYLTNHLLSLFTVFWIAAACALCIIFTPGGNRHLINPHHSGTQLPWQTWFCSIALLELTLIGGYLGIAALCGNFLTVNTTAHADLFETSLKLFSLQYGFFPWTLYAVIAAGMGYVAYHDETDAYMSNLLKSFVHIEPQSFFGLIANIGMRRCVIFSVSILLVFTTLLLTNFLLPINTYIAHGFNTSAIIVTLSLFALSYSDTVKSYLLKLFSRNIPTYLSLSLFCVILGAACIILTLLSNSLYKTAVSPPNTLATQWIHYDWQTAWLLFSALWFLCLTPLICSVIARLSKGYSARNVVLGVIALPFAFTLFYSLNNMISFSFTPSEFLISFISALSLLVLMPLLINHTHLTNAIFAYLPKNGLHKNRSYHSFITEITRSTAIALFLYLTVGINGLALLLFAPNFLSIITLPLTAMAVVRRLLK